jgi:hypothetical protein
MTIQMDDFAAQQSRDGWKMARIPHGGNHRIHLLDERADTLRSIDLESWLPEFSRFAHWTTAGMYWSQQMLAYFTARQRHLVIRAWWGERLVVALDRLDPIDPRELSDELKSTESEIVLQGLKQLVFETENGAQPQYLRPPTDLIHCSVRTLAHFPGLLGLAEAVPFLYALEERLEGSGECWGSFHYYPHGTRRLAQISLRRLGKQPRGFPVLRFTETEKRIPLRRIQSVPIDGMTRHANLSRIRRSTPLTEIYQLLGAPDEIGSGKHNFWRYDVDVEQPYTVLLWLGEDDEVARTVRYLPPFWAGPELFPSRTISLLDSDGTTVNSFIDQLDDDTFIGRRIELDVLQELESSGLYPLSPLARAIIDCKYEALGPLVDALEEADDPRTPQVRCWLKR